MGPAAAADFLTLLAQRTPALVDQEHIPLIHYSDPQTPDRSTAIQGLGPDPLPQLIAGVQFLDHVGCDVIAIPCNSAHHWFDELQTAVSVPILHIIDAAISALGAGPNSRRVGVLATEGTLASGAYSRRLRSLGHEPVVPTDAVRSTNVSPGIQLAKAGDLGRAQELLLVAVEELLSQGAEHVILGCTDISAALRPDIEKAVQPLVDASEALVGAVLQHLAGGRSATADLHRSQAELGSDALGQKWSGG